MSCWTCSPPWTARKDALSTATEGSKQRQAKTKQSSFGIAQGMHFAGQGFCQFLKDCFNRPPLAVTGRERLGARVPSRDIAQEVNFGVPIPGRLMQGHCQAS